MAQRTGAERFLAPPAKSASAGVALALALAALCLGGCGGGSADPDTASTQTSEGAAAAPGSPAAADATAKAKAEDEAQAQAPGQGGQGGGSSSAPGGGSAPGQGQAHGRIALPKGPREEAPTPAEIAQATVADMRLESPAILAADGALGRLAPTYTCDGADSWPALRWSGVPAGSAELVLFVMNLQPVDEKLFVDWAVAGLDPGLGGIEAGELPKGAVVGTNGFGERGYSICPQGDGETYMFAVYALPKRLSPPKGFDGRELRKAVLALSGNVGLLPAVYGRG